MSALLAHLPLLRPATRWQPPGLQPCSCKPAPLTGHATGGSTIWRAQQVPGASSCRAHAGKVLASAVLNPGSSSSGTGYNAKGKKTLAHPEYLKIQQWWHPTKNQGKAAADLTHGSKQKVWLQCPGCRHGCGRVHEWQGIAGDCTRNLEHLVCPKCESRSGGFCPCRSVESHPTLSKEWHPDNPPASTVSTSSNFLAKWNCLKGHPSYVARCHNRSVTNTGCPVCGVEKARTTRHPPVSDRPALLKEWMHEKNDIVPEEVTLGSRYPAWWKCSNPEHPPWQARVCDRALKGTGCPNCKSKNRFKPREFA